MAVTYTFLLVTLAFSAGLYLGILLAAWKLGKHLHVARTRTIELEGMVRKQGLLAREVAHELKNPISAVVCAAEALELLLDSTLDTTQRRTLRHISNYGGHILKVMGDFIDVSRGVSGELSSVKEPVTVAEVVAAVTGLLSPAAGRKGVEIEVAGADAPLCAYVDPKHLKQILFNVVDNAVKFSPQHRTVAVSLKRELAHNRIVLEVSDSGPGMSDRDISKLMNGNRIAPREGSFGEKGSGIGLLLSRTLAALENIEIVVNSALGVGTRITLSLPAHVAREVEASSSIPVSYDDQPLVGQKVLLIDSDPEMRDVVARLIEALGGTVDGVAIAVEAVEALHKKMYSAVMINEHSDGAHGCEIAHMVKCDPSTRDVRVVVASPNPLDPDVVRESRADRCIGKPLDKRSLIESLLPTH